MLLIDKYVPCFMYLSFWTMRCLVVVQGSIPGWDRPKSLKRVLTTTLQNAQQEMQVSQVLGDNQYKGFNHVTVGVAYYVKEPLLLKAMNAEHTPVGQNL